MSISAAGMQDLHRIHQQLTDLRERLAAGPKQITNRQINVTRLEAELAKAKDEHKAARVSADQKQLLLKAGEQKIRDRRTQLNQCNTNREYQTMVEQIAGDEMTNSVLEDEILEALDKIERAQQGVALAEGNIVKAKAELVKATEAVRATEDSLKTDVHRLEGELAEREKTLPADFLEVYARLVKARGEDALAKVDGDCCGGCYQQLTPNVINQILMERIIVCAGCGRLLYKA
ncbi:MAG: phospholipase [Planctomycetia bacterium]|nr:phospholipase [Planctomycetia bacterium]